MIVVMRGLYHEASSGPAYFQNIGDGCFQFTSSREDASDMTLEECQKVVDGKEYYLKMYGASELVIEEKEVA